MNEKLIVVLLLITIVLSIVSVALVFDIPLGIKNFANLQGATQDQPSTVGSVGFSIEPVPGGGG